MKVLTSVAIIITFLFFNSVSAQQVVEAPASDFNETPRNFYSFNFQRALANKKGQTDFPFRLDTLSLFIEDSARFHYSNQLSLSEKPHVCQNRFLKFGVADIYHRTILPFEYEFIQPEYDESFLVVKKGCLGAINTAGSVIVPFKYASAVQLDDNFFQFYYFKKEKLIDVYNRTGKLVFTMKASILNKVGARYYSVLNEKGKFEKLIDSTGKQILTASEYANIRWVRNGFICYYKNGKAGVINLKKEPVLPCMYSNISSTNMDQFIVYDSSMSGIVNSKNEYIIPLRKANLVNFGNFYIAYGYGYSDKKLLVNKEGRLISKNTFYIGDVPSDIEQIFGKKQENKFLVVTETTTRRQGIYNAAGQQVIPPMYYTLNYDANLNLVVGAKPDKKDSLKVVYEVWDLDGRNIIHDFPYLITLMSGNKNVMVITDKKNKSGFINIKTGKSKISFAYEWLSYRSKLADGYFTAKRDWFYALFSPEGDKLTPEIYSDFKMPDIKSQLIFGDKLFCFATRDDKVYGMTKNGEEFELLRK